MTGCAVLINQNLVILFKILTVYSFAFQLHLKLMAKNLQLLSKFNSEHFKETISKFYPFMWDFISFPKKEAWHGLKESCFPGMINHKTGVIIVLARVSTPI